MILPTLWVEIFDASGTDRNGQPLLTAAGREKVAPVRLDFAAQKTTVRTDSSGSHGNARETVADIVILAVPKTRIRVDDVVSIHGNLVQVTGTHPRYTVTGTLDHFELSGQIWVR